MKGSVVIALLMPLVACVPAETHADDSSGMIIQVVQEVHDSGCGGGCCGNDCSKPQEPQEPQEPTAWCHLGPSGVGVYMSEGDMTHDEAKNFCSMKGDSLLAINNAAIFEEVINILREEEGGNHRDFWVDGCDMHEEDTWKFSDGHNVPMGPPFWDLEMHRPTYDNESNCLAMQVSRGYYWRDAPCHYLNRAVCMCHEGEEPAIPPSHDCPGNYTFVWDRCVRILPELVEEFEEGKTACLDDGGHLLRLTCPNMLRSFSLHLLMEAFEGETYSEIIFVAGELDSMGVFRFWDGTAAPMGSPYWEVGHPTGEADHWHFSTSTFLVNDVPCDAPPPPATTPAPPATTPAPSGHHNHNPTGPFNVACEHHG